MLLRLDLLLVPFGRNIEKPMETSKKRTMELGKIAAAVVVVAVMLMVLVVSKLIRRIGQIAAVEAWRHSQTVGQCSTSKLRIFCQLKGNETQTK